MALNSNTQIIPKFNRLQRTGEIPILANEITPDDTLQKLKESGWKTGEKFERQLGAITITDPNQLTINDLSDHVVKLLELLSNAHASIVSYRDRIAQVQSFEKKFRNAPATKPNKNIRSIKGTMKLEFNEGDFRTVGYEEVLYYDPEQKIFSEKRIITNPLAPEGYNQDISELRYEPANQLNLKIKTMQWFLAQVKERIDMTERILTNRKIELESTRVYYSAELVMLNTKIQQGDSEIRPGQPIMIQPSFLATIQKKLECEKEFGKAGNDIKRIGTILEWLAGKSIKGN